MLKKLVVLLGLAGLAVAVKAKLDQNNDAKDLWAQAADKPGDSTN
ncbi:DLW-39 family protein [Flexivirga sp. B27]